MGSINNPCEWEGKRIKRRGGASLYLYMYLYAGTVKCSPVVFNYNNCITIMKLISLKKKSEIEHRMV